MNIDDPAKFYANVNSENKVEARPLKICILADQYFNPSGVGVYTRELIKNLLRIDTSNEYIVLYPERRGTASNV